SRPRVRLLVLIGYCAFQYCATVSSIVNPSSSLSQIAMLPYRGGDPSVRLFQAYPLDQLAPATIAVFSLSINLPDKVWDFVALNVIAKERVIQNLYFGYPWDFTSVADAYKSLWEHYQYALLDVTTQDNSDKSRTEPYSILTSNMISRWRSSTLSEAGL